MSHVAAIVGEHEFDVPTTVEQAATEAATVEQSILDMLDEAERLAADWRTVERRPSGQWDPDSGTFG